jgi:hypothetical protein
MMRNHVNFCGREICAGQSCDTMVRGDQRGKGWFVRLATVNYEQAAAGGLQAVVGFPNRNSFPGFMRSLDWRRITSLREYTCRLGYRRLWGGTDALYKLILRAGLRGKTFALRLWHERLDIVVSDVLSDNLGELLDEVRNHEVLSIWKDLPYLRWRYESHPENSYTFHVLLKAGRAEGLVVSRTVGSTIAICELVHRRRDVRESVVFLNSLLTLYAREPWQKVEFFGHDDGFFQSVFRACGFAESYSSGFVFGGRVFGGGPLEGHFPHAANWTVSYGDTDVV